MTKGDQKRQGNSANVEFGVEFGDMNASKLFEIPFMNEDKKEKKDKKNGNKTG